MGVCPLAIDKRTAQFIFQFFDAVGESWLRNFAIFGRTREIQGFAERYKIPYPPDFQRFVPDILEQFPH